MFFIRSRLNDIRDSRACPLSRRLGAPDIDRAPVGRLALARMNDGPEFKISMAASGGKH